MILKAFAILFCMKSDKKHLLKITCICFLGAAIFGAVGGYLWFGNNSWNSRTEQILYVALAGFLMLLCLGTAILFIVSYMKKTYALKRARTMKT